SRPLQPLPCGSASQVLLPSIRSRRLTRQTPARLRRERRRSSPKLPVNLRKDFREPSALRQPGIDTLDPALDLFLPRGVHVRLSSCFAAFQKSTSESQLLIVRQPQRILRALRQLRTHTVFSRPPRTSIHGRRFSAVP